MAKILKDTRLLLRMLVILCLSGASAGCYTESGNDYNLSPSVQKIEGGASMGQVTDAQDAYSHAKYIQRS